MNIQAFRGIFNVFRQSYESYVNLPIFQSVLLRPDLPVIL